MQRVKFRPHALAGTEQHEAFSAAFDKADKVDKYADGVGAEYINAGKVQHDKAHAAGEEVTQGGGEFRQPFQGEVAGKNGEGGILPRCDAFYGGHFPGVVPGDF